MTNDPVKCLFSDPLDDWWISKFNKFLNNK